MRKQSLTLAMMALPLATQAGGNGNGHAYGQANYLEQLHERIEERIFTKPYPLVALPKLCVGKKCDEVDHIGKGPLSIQQGKIRLNFIDTTERADKPSNDWQLRINDNFVGGEDYFAIKDKTAQVVPFRIDAGAESNTLRVSTSGRVGINTESPEANLHISAQDTPSIRLEQTTTEQTWQLGGNENGFFLEDVSNLQQRPFTVASMAPENSFSISESGRIGLNTDNPSAPLHIKKNVSDYSQLIMIENENATEYVGMRMQASSSWVDINNSNSEFRVNFSNSSGGAEFVVDKLGNVTVKGDINFSIGNKKYSLSDIVRRLEALETPH